MAISTSFYIFLSFACLGAISCTPVFVEKAAANGVLTRRVRANSFLEEMRPGNLERECYEEACSFEEAYEIFKNKKKTDEFWNKYNRQPNFRNQCLSNPCYNGTCIQQTGDFFCNCKPEFEGRLCQFPVSATNCSDDNGGCDHICNEDPDKTRRSCGCLPGYKLKNDHRQCQATDAFPCGKVQVAKAEKPELDEPRIKPLVAGGQKGKKGQSPWQALILNASGRFHCGGVLIDHSWVLTAAHCVQDGTKFSVRLGDYERRRFEDTEITIPVSEVVCHANHDKDTADNDIALLRLQTPVTYTKFIVPVCLPQRNLAEQMLMRNGTNVTVTGWGRERENSTSYSSALNFIEIPLALREQCAELMLNPLTDNMLCAGVLGGSKDACSGDSGGPMVTKFKRYWFLVGLVSWGEGCGRMDKLGVYTKVSNYLEWIKNVRKEKNSRV
ncbi:vitamin K-dependent protein C-like isoform X2 [Polyodon spathula]|uniref:vitamin K-dependent protein C-like isoform X2 n=1 Tax=Polyodon spathula TaxID=7913 RepID=UPI001B7F0D04|nr:vitamin K-dependent protein C-like isoform X2 [Polyodon spathula]